MAYGKKQKTRALTGRRAGFCTLLDFLKRVLGGIGGMEQPLETRMDTGFQIFSEGEWLH